MLDEPRRERMLNVPAIVVALLAALGLVHVLLRAGADRRSRRPSRCCCLLSSPRATTPACCPTSSGREAGRPTSGPSSPMRSSTPISLTWPSTQCGFWLSARRWRSDLARMRFVGFMAATAAAGAAVHLVTHFGELLPMVGASAAISGAMAAAMRFAFQRGGPLGLWRDREAACRVPAAPLAASLRDPRVIAFLLVWFGVNILFGVFSIGARGRRRRRSPGRRISVGLWPACCVCGVRSGSDGDRARRRQGPDSATGIH